MKKKRKIRATYPEAEAHRLEIKEAASAYGIECEVVNVREAKDQLSDLLDRAAKGERIIITSDGVPKAMIVRYRPIIQGKPWSSKKHPLITPLVVEDSTPFIRAERDSQY